jgi:NTE family protein
MLPKKKLDPAIVMALALFLIGIAMILLCCTPSYNLQKRQDFEALKYDISQDNQDQSSLVFATFSGGGSKSACMSWEVLKELKKIKYEYTGRYGERVKSNLAKQIDYISGISGGSFAAAGWCIYKDSMELFDKKFINQDIQMQILAGLLFPVNLIKSISGNYNRINVASELYDKAVFNRYTFGQLPAYPVLWIGSTVLSIGLQFSYTQSYFDMLGSDIR